MDLKNYQRLVFSWLIKIEKLIFLCKSKNLSWEKMEVNSANLSVEGRRFFVDGFCVKWNCLTAAFKIDKHRRVNLKLSFACVQKKNPVIQKTWFRHQFAFKKSESFLRKLSLTIFNLNPHFGKPSLAFTSSICFVCLVVCADNNSNTW